MTTLSEADSKARLAPFGVPFPTEHLVETAEAAVATAAALGGPVWAWIGVVPLATGAIGWCPPYAMFGFNTCSMKNKA